MSKTLDNESKQRSLTGDFIEYPECDFPDCTSEASRVFEVRGWSKDELYICQKREHEPLCKGGGGVEDVRPVLPEKDAVSLDE